MRPPICRVCGRDFRDQGPDGEGDLLYFSPRWLYTVFEVLKGTVGVTGHPSNAEWFCSEHVEDARELTHLPPPIAMWRLRRKYGTEMAERLDAEDGDSSR